MSENLYKCNHILIKWFLAIPAFCLILFFQANLLTAEESVVVKELQLNIGAEHPGVQARVVKRHDSLMGQVWRTNFDFSQGGVYVGLQSSVKLSKNHQLLKFQIKGSGAIVRIQDATGQWFATHVHGVTHNAWRQFEVPLKASRFAEAHWGGAIDGVVHLPIKSFLIGTDSKQSKIKYFDLAEVCFTVDTQETNILSQAGWRVTHQSNLPSGIAFLNEQAICDFTIYSPLKKQKHAVLSVRLENDQGQVKENRYDITLKPDSSSVKSIELNTENFGYSLINATLLCDGQVMAVDESAVAVVRRPINWGREDKDSFFGLCEVWDMQAAERIGCKSIRHGIPWDYYEWDQGQYKLPVLGKYLNRLKDNHMTCLLTISSWAPHWARRPGETYHKLPDPKYLDNWGEFIQRVGEYLAKHPEGHRIQIIDIDNEPDLHIWLQRGFSLSEAVDIYASLYSHAGEALRSTAATASFGGLGVSGGMFDMGLPFSEAVFRTGVKSDVFTGHIYSGARVFGRLSYPSLPEADGFDNKARRALDLMSRYQMPRRLSVAEYGWALDTREALLGQYAKMQAAAITQSFVIAKTVSELERIYYFLQRPHTEGNARYGLFKGERKNMYPMLGAVAYSTTANLLDGSQWTENISIHDGLRVDCFKRDQDHSVVMSIWSRSGELQIRSDVPYSTRVINLWGREVDSGSVLDLTVNEQPVFLVVDSNDAQGLLAGIKGAQISAAAPFVVENIYLKKLDQACVSLFNNMNKPLNVRVVYGYNTERVYLNPGNNQVDLTLGSTQQIKRGAIPVLVQTDQYTNEIELEYDLHPIVAIGDVNIDGILSESDMATMLEVRQRKDILPPDPVIPWDGPEDLSFKTQLAWKQDGLYLFVEVTDDVHCAAEHSTASNYWMSDSLQLAIDTKGDSGIGYGADDSELGFVLTEKGPAAYIGLKPLLCDFTIKRNGVKTVYEALIPWKILKVECPEANRVMAINIMVNENDGQGRILWMGLTPGLGEVKAPKLYKRFYFSRN
ncbi:MAG: sugar-binding protein [Phycisphaeraceae bacterium JB051]